ncbi:MAG: tetratricopeptide repeat protein [Deltaproteobacteria bacterium]|nr:tetratricopeptide repeat protein [Deltaproteobacteria bacterium]
MSERDRCDVVLFGYRNDLARERVLEHLAAMAPTPEGPPPIDRSTPIPQRLFGQIPAQRAQQLRQEFEGLGAHIKLVPVAAPPAFVVSTASPRGARWSLATLLVVVVGAAAVWWLPQPRQVAHLPVLPVAPARPAPLAQVDPPPAEEAQSETEAQALALNAQAVALAQQGQYEPAIERLRQALRVAPEQPVVRQNLQTALLNSALRKLEAHQSAEALAQLDEALGFGERSDARHARGLAHLQAADYESARVDLEQAIAAGVKDSGALLALGEVYLRLNDRQRALATLQRARDAGAQSPQLDTLLERLSREVDAEWDFSALENGHFRVTFAEGENRVAAQLVLEGLEDARHEVAVKLGSVPDRTTEVVLYAAQDFHAITQTPVWAAGAYDGRIKVPVRGLERHDPALPRLLRHEYMHSVVAELSRQRCPAWLSEGLAVWAEEEHDGERRAWAEEAVSGSELFRLHEISGPFTHLAQPRAQVAYAQSYLAVRELIDRYGTRKLPQLVSDLGQQPLPVAFAATYPGSLADFEERWLSTLGS